MTDRKSTIIGIVLFILIAIAIITMIQRAQGGDGQCPDKSAAQTPEANSPPVCLVSDRSEVAPPSASPGNFIDDCLDYIVWAESRNGTDPNCQPGIVGPAGELGPWQVTPIYVADIKRLTGEVLDPYDCQACREAARVYLQHYMRYVAVETICDAHELYRRGLTGYRNWKGE